MESPKGDISSQSEYVFTELEIDVFLQRKQDFLDGKTTARDWKEIDDDLNRTFTP